MNHTKEPENSVQGRGWCTLGLLIPTPESKILPQKRCSPATCASGSFFSGRLNVAMQELVKIKNYVQMVDANPGVPRKHPET